MKHIVKFPDMKISKNTNNFCWICRKGLLHQQSIPAEPKSNNFFPKLWIQIYPKTYSSSFILKQTKKAWQLYSILFCLEGILMFFLTQQLGYSLRFLKTKLSRIVLTCSNPPCNKYSHPWQNTSAPTPALVYIHSIWGTAGATVCPRPGGSICPRSSPHSRHTRQASPGSWRAWSGTEWGERKEAEGWLIYFQLKRSEAEILYLIIYKIYVRVKPPKIYTYFMTFIRG